MALPSMIANPDLYLYKETEKRIKDDLNTAFEIFIAEQYSRLRYSDLMPDGKPGLASKTRLVSWLNDNASGKTIRHGVITKYKNDYPSHFLDGIWEARYFGFFVGYMKQLLTSKKFIKSRKIADEFSRSFADEEWFWQAVAVAGAKLLEDLYERGGLRTDIAKAYIRQIKLSRELLDNLGRIAGRIAKNCGERYGRESIDAVQGSLETIKDVVESSFKEQLRSSFEIFSNRSEYRIYLRYKEEIRKNFVQVRHKQSTYFNYLTAAGQLPG
ncbi:hypothetical protein H0A61_03005 [Koleobacter methoxysyntrophicus]|uniref:Uncharacterized protein n=1 Tax=Koleobacter methoxysyntrophicus TaxID=2751313 RepID=A0A8A0RQA5_9FIRM|nr:hypothetical protein [Koleobacter methoxysyntrophicus]QSQ10595.1 hypothetical protein H0A61_03005 [Koleobacter methoxysyntrophicus]